MGPGTTRAICTVRKALWAAWDIISDFYFQFPARSFTNLFLFNYILILSKPIAPELLCFSLRAVGLQTEHVWVPLWQRECFKKLTLIQ